MNRQEVLEGLYDLLNETDPTDDAYAKIRLEVEALEAIDITNAKLDVEYALKEERQKAEEKAKKKKKKAKKKAKKRKKKKRERLEAENKKRWLTGLGLTAGSVLLKELNFYGALDRIGKFEETNAWTSRASSLLFDHGKRLIDR